MPRRKLPPNSPCPCNSGKKYEHCCHDKGFDWVVDENGNIGKSVPVSDELAEVIKEQHQKFAEEFGREPGPDDNLFFNMPHQEVVEHVMVERMKEAGLDPAIIYACGLSPLSATCRLPTSMHPGPDSTLWQPTAGTPRPRVAYGPPSRSWAVGRRRHCRAA